MIKYNIKLKMLKEKAFVANIKHIIIVIKNLFHYSYKEICAQIKRHYLDLLICILDK